MSKPSVVMGIRGYGRVPAETSFSLQILTYRSHELLHPAVVNWTNWCFVDQSANHIVREALKLTNPRPTHLWFGDSDMLFPPETIHWLLGHDQECVGGLYFGRTAPHNPIAGHFATEKEHRPLQSIPERFSVVDYVGPGCMLVEIDLLEDMRQYFGDELWFNYQGDGHFGEDLWFCRRLRKMGRAVYLDSTLECPHLTDQAITRSHWQAYKGQTANSPNCFLDYPPGVEPIAHAPEEWCDFTGLYADVVDRLPDKPIVVELGCFIGRSAIVMVNFLNRRFRKAEGQPFRFFVVDNFQARGTSGQANPDDTVLMKAGGSYRPHLEKNLREAGVYDRVTIIQGDTADVGKSRFFDDGTVDFVFVDADHSYEGCKTDIEAWLPKLKPGGIMAGHDYDWPSVRKAVAETIPNALQRGRRCWVWRKPS